MGSHNLTGGGLWTNFESSAIIPVAESDGVDTQILNSLEDYFNKLESLEDSIMSISSQDDIDKLLKNGYVLKEVAEQIRNATTKRDKGGRESLFGSGVKAQIPRISGPKKEKATGVSDNKTKPASIPLDYDDQTIWFETRKLTGGSRNILDLSMKSLIESGDPSGTSFDLEDQKFMRGGVEFFGLNPSDTNEIKNITINFEGVDYQNNTILFPDGEKANGTWRLQIKGISASQKKITEAFKVKDDKHYLVEKIITFTKVKDDYYFMSVFPETELDDFKNSSKILARNGSTKSAKYFGLL